MRNYISYKDHHITFKNLQKCWVFNKEYKSDLQSFKNMIKETKEINFTIEKQLPRAANAMVKF